MIPLPASLRAICECEDSVRLLRSVRQLCHRPQGVACETVLGHLLVWLAKLWEDNGDTTADCLLSIENGLRRTEDLVLAIRCLVADQRGTKDVDLSRGAARVLQDDCVE